MDLTAQRVATRYKQRIAESIGDPARLVHNFRVVVDFIAALEEGIPAAREAEKVLQRGEDDPGWQGARRIVQDTAIKIGIRLTRGYAQLRDTGHMLFLAILQQYELPAAQRKAVEAAAKFFSRGTVQKPAKGKEIEVYEKYLATYREQFALAKAIIAQGKLRGESSVEPEHEQPVNLVAGPFKLVNTGGFAPEIMNEAAKVVETAAKLLQAKGLGKVCYGEVLISNTLMRPSVLAFYLMGKDEFFVRANLKGKEHDAVQTVVHELGHRLHFKFMQSKDREIQAMYRQINRKAEGIEHALIKDPDLRPKPGDKLVSKGKTYSVEKVVYDEVTLVRDDDPKQMARVSVPGWIRMKGIDTSAHGTSFVTQYAGKNHEENFAEMIAYYCMNKLPADQVEMLQQVLG